MISHAEAWFSALGEPLSDAERMEIEGYLAGLAMTSSLHAVSSWEEARDICARPAKAWWQAEEEERSRLDAKVKLEPSDPRWLRLNEVLHRAAGASVPAQVRSILRRALAARRLQGTICHLLK